MAGLDWAAILRRAGIAEPPGRAELIATIQAERAHRLADQRPSKGGQPAPKPATTTPTPGRSAARDRLLLQA